jgi:hypothetical protein
VGLLTSAGAMCLDAAPPEAGKIRELVGLDYLQKRHGEDFCFHTCRLVSTIEPIGQGRLSIR